MLYAMYVVIASNNNRDKAAAAHPGSPVVTWALPFLPFLLAVR